MRLSSSRLSLSAATVLLAVAAQCLQQAVGIKCTVTELDGSTSIFSPGAYEPDSAASPTLGRSRAPFFYGTATAAYQVEGAVREGGRGPSIWDAFAHTPGKTFGNQTGDVACDFYARYPEDVALMRALGIRHFRFSLAWPRLLPSGRGEVNPAGAAFYNRLIDALLEAGIEPHVTLYHWDLPLWLHKEYGGWLHPQVVSDFAAYAEAAFRLFGDRVKSWFTLNEPETFCGLGYGSGIFAPGRCSDRTRCQQGDSDAEPLLCAYHATVAHATAVQSFRKLVSGGRIAMTLGIAWNEPLTGSAEDAAAAERLQAFNGGFFLDPLYTGDWGELRKRLHGPLLPAFTPDQRRLLLENQQDFLALQHYTGAYAWLNASSAPLNASTGTTDAEGVQLPVADSPWLCVFPTALRRLLVWLHRRYQAPPIVITENGVSAPGEADKTAADPSLLCDKFRVSYFQQYISNATAAVREDGVRLEGYFAWSLLDNFEWADGYAKRFGIVYVDYATQRRYVKASALWLSRWFGLGDSAGTGNAGAAGQAADGGTEEEHAEL